MWEIFVIGDVKFLQAILNGVAMIFSGSTIWVAAKIFLLLSIIQLGLMAVLQNTFMPIQQLAITWLIVGAMFVPRVEVALLDRSSQLSVKVANVPFGVAAFGSFTSRFGYAMAEGLAVAFRNPRASSTTPAVNGNLNQLLQLRSRILDAMLTDKKQNSSLARSWQNYLNDCTNIALSLNRQAQGAKNIQQLFASPLPDALSLESGIYFTEVYLNSTTRTLSCSQSFAQLKTATVNFSADQLQSLAARPSDGLISGMNVSQLNQSIVSISQGHLDAQKFIMAIAMSQMLSQMPAYTQLGEAVMAQSLSTVYSQWTVQGNIFTQTVRPLLTFLEGFFYAIVPFMFLIMMLGMWGIRMLGKFVMLLIWLQMWQPIITIIDLYYQQALSRSLLEIHQSFIAIDSFWGITQFTQKLESYLATSGILLSSVGSLALFIIYGGAVAATSLASKLAPTVPQAAANLTPAAIASAPVIAAGSHYSSDVYQGIRTTGSERAVGSVNLAHSLSYMQASGSNALSNQQANISSTQGTSFTASSASIANQSTSQSSSYSQLQSAGRHAASSQSIASQDTSVESLGNTYSRTSGINMGTSVGINPDWGSMGGRLTGAIPQGLPSMTIPSTMASSGGVGTSENGVGSASSSTSSLANLDSQGASGSPTYPDQPHASNAANLAANGAAQAAATSQGATAGQIGTIAAPLAPNGVLRSGTLGSRFGASSSTATVLHEGSSVTASQSVAQSQQSGTSQQQVQAASRQHESGQSYSNSASQGSAATSAFTTSQQQTTIAQQEYRMLQQMQQQFSSSQEMSILSLAQRVNAQPAAANYLASIVNANPTLARAATNYERMYAPNIPDLGQRQAAANIAALFNAGGANNAADQARLLWLVTHGHLPQSNILGTIPGMPSSPAAHAHQAQQTPAAPTKARSPQQAVQPPQPQSPQAPKVGIANSQAPYMPSPTPVNVHDSQQAKHIQEQWENLHKPD